MSKSSAPKEKTPPRKRVAVESAEIADQVLAIRFDELWEILAAPPDTAEAEEERLLSRIDLLGRAPRRRRGLRRRRRGDGGRRRARTVADRRRLLGGLRDPLDDTDYERAYGPPLADAKAFLRPAATDLLDDAFFAAVARALVEAEKVGVRP